MGIIGVLLALAFIIFREKENIKNRWSKREKIVFFLSLIMGASVTIAWILQVNLINPMRVLTDLYRPLSEPFVTYMNQFK